MFFSGLAMHTLVHKDKEEFVRKVMCGNLGKASLTHMDYFQCRYLFQIQLESAWQGCISALQLN